MTSEQQRRNSRRRLGLITLVVEDERAEHELDNSSKQVVTYITIIEVTLIKVVVLILLYMVRKLKVTIRIVKKFK